MNISSILSIIEVLAHDKNNITHRFITSLVPFHPISKAIALLSKEYATLK